MSTPQVRELGPGDATRVAALERELFGPSAWSVAMVREEIGGPGRFYVGIDAEPGTRTPALVPSSDVVAYAGSWFDGDVTQVMTLAVAGVAQRRGYGRVLLATLVGRARADGASAVLLEVRVDNEPAIALYRAAGFEVLGRRRRYYQPEDVDAFTMRLGLDGTSSATP